MIVLVATFIPRLGEMVSEVGTARVFSWFQRLELLGYSVGFRGWNCQGIQLVSEVGTDTVFSWFQRLELLGYSVGFRGWNC